MDFDRIIPRLGTRCSKWDMMEPLFGIPAEDGIAMWVADMDFRPPACVDAALRGMIEHGIYGYFGDDAAYREAIRWWWDTRHGWDMDKAALFTTHGLVNGTAMCVETVTEPGDAVVLMTPVYHAFHRILRAAGREIRELPLALRAGRYEMDFAAWEPLMTGAEKALVLCSPHNPGGRVWSRAELEAVAEFARRHDLYVISDEIHADLVLPGAPRHLPMARIEGIEDRLFMLLAGTKTFNLAGAHVGNVVVPDLDLRARFARRMQALGISPNSFGLVMMTAAFSPEGAEWVDALTAYIDGNRRVFDAAVDAIPGLRSMPLEGTYLAWVDFSGAGMDSAEAARRVIDTARIAVNRGPDFGAGGEGFLRFNLATPRALVEEAAGRLRDAFADLQ